MNDEMVMMDGSGTRCLHQKRKQCLEFALPKPGEICKHLAGAYNSNSHARWLHYRTFIREKQAEKSTQWGELF